MSNKHKNYYTLNLMGYGLAKFDMAFVHSMTFKTKQSFYQYLVEINVADTTSVIKNRQDLFDPFFENSRKGWWQKGDTYIHRKHLIDSFFGTLNVEEYADIVKLHLATDFLNKQIKIKPVLESKFRRLQETGNEAELYFLHNYTSIEAFKDGAVEDARLYGDGYDFQIQVGENYFLSEVKGVREKTGGIRLTEKEFSRAEEYKEDYALSVISNLNDIPKMTIIFNPLSELELFSTIVESKNVSYHTKSLSW